jgi:cob(I)alamin adenosyltransferase
MGFMDKIRNFFGKTHDESSTQVRVNDVYEKRMLAEEIVDLVGKIKKINSFDSSINSFSYVSSYELQQRDLEELQAIASKLEKKLSYLNQQSRSNKSTVSDLEASKWTGRKPQNMSTYDYDRMQRDDDGR